MEMSEEEEERSACVERKGSLRNREEQSIDRKHAMARGNPNPRKGADKGGDGDGDGVGDQRGKINKK